MVHPTPSSPPQSHSIEARDLVKTYAGNVRALDGASFTVQSGSIFALLGPNGAGKSTAVKILTTLSRPDSGQAFVEGIGVQRDPDRVRRLIGVVSQRSGADIDATGRENLALQGHVYGMRGQELRSRVDELLRQFDLAGAADRIVRTYSGGMRRKLDVAVGLVHRPRVLFLDEPTTGLDPEARTRLWDEVRRLAHRDGITVLLTTHYLDEADHLADRLAILDGGRVIIEGSPDALKREFQGDGLIVELDGAADASIAVEAASTVKGLSQVRLDDRALRARASNGPAAVPALLDALEWKGLEVMSIAVSRPSLDDVYLRHVGRAFHAAEEAIR
ncbi:MAG TPA: ATP-binding cassette domain-containing protein [Tepidiformaceae bacterium]|nr:ATP-binding cassette domain-containing protein [Tepidiformaceae bacterium]